MSVNACRKAIKEWGGSVDDITHVVSTTCTNSANPGFDHFVVKQLGIKSSVEKVLLHGVGCSGGLAAIRTASNLALGSSFRKKAARILVIACEISSLLVRSELDSIDKDQTVRIGVCLFSDCASSIVLSNGVGEDDSINPVYDLLGWRHDTLADTDQDLGFDVDPSGMYAEWLRANVTSFFLLFFFKQKDICTCLRNGNRLESCPYPASSRHSIRSSIARFSSSRQIRVWHPRFKQQDPCRRRF